MTEIHSPLGNTVSSGQNVASVTKKLNLQFYLTLIHLNLNRQVVVLDSRDLKAEMKNTNEGRKNNTRVLQ